METIGVNLSGGPSKLNQMHKFIQTHLDTSKIIIKHPLYAPLISFTHKASENDMSFAGFIDGILYYFFLQINSLLTIWECYTCSFLNTTLFFMTSPIDVF